MDAKKRKVEDELVPPLPTSAEEKSLEEKDVSKLLETLTNDQLIDLLRSAAARDPATLDSIRAADLDPSHLKLYVLDHRRLVRGLDQKTASDVLRPAELDRKLLVHGFRRNTTSDVLRAAFAPFGEIDDCIVPQDKFVGYGFVLFRHSAAANAALRAPKILVEGCRATCKLLSNIPPDSRDLPTRSTDNLDRSCNPPDVSKLLKPLAKHHLIYLLRSAAARDPATLDSIRTAADLDPSHRKRFFLDRSLLVRGLDQKTASDVLRPAELDRKLLVHGFRRSTTSDVLRAAFAPFGEVDDCIVPQDKFVGYGFVLFRHSAAANAALRAPKILVEDCRATCKLLSNIPPDSRDLPTRTLDGSCNLVDGTRILKLSSGARYGPKLPRDNGNPLRKIYVGNVPPDVDGTRLREFFARYGEIEEGPIGFDPNTGKSEGFVLFVYRSAESARKVLVESSKNFEGHLLYCQSPNAEHPLNTAAEAEAITAQLDPVSVGMNHQATVLAILASLNRGAATTSANQGPAGYQGNPGSQGSSY